MSNRIIKNFTDQEYVLSDLGDITIPANGAIDLGGNEQRLIDLATSDSLLQVLALGTDKIAVNDGIHDYTFSQGIDLIRRINTPLELDAMGRPVMRADSRRRDYETVFMGAGDDVVSKTIGAGTEFRFDFSDESNLISAPEGYLRKRINWHFCDLIYMKEGTMYFYNAPKGSYIDMYLVAPAGYPYQIKSVDSAGNIIRTFQIAQQETVFQQWVCKYWIEGSAPMGDELNTEASSDLPAYPYMIWRAEITVPNVEGYQSFHGHWSLEAYRSRSV